MSRFPSGGTISLRELIFEVQVDPEEFLAQLRGGKFEPVQRDGPTLSYRFRTSEMRDVFWRDFREYEAGRRKRMSQRRENAIISLFGGVAAGLAVSG